MSIHREVSVHCDRCGHWQHGNEQTTAQRRKAGWSIWKDEASGKTLHLCPSCKGQATAYGERPPS